MKVSRVRENKAIEMSKGDALAIEFTGGVRCPHMCDYCPQDIYMEANEGAVIRELTFNTILRCLPNIPRNCLVKWTGFTEPLACRDFRLIAAELARCGYKQSISTTLMGREKNCGFVEENAGVFSSMTLHLPDSRGLMKGTFDAGYGEYVDRVVSACISCQVDLTLFLIGEDWHHSIKGVVEQYPHLAVMAKYLNTRSGSVDVGAFGLKVTEPVSNASGVYYCSYRRLNQGVLLPDGRVSVCCQDYGLKLIIGDLTKHRLVDIYSRIESQPLLRSQFLGGSLEPCAHCEHYRDISAGSSTCRV